MLVAVTVLALLAAHSCRLPSGIVKESEEIVHTAESAIDRSAETMQGFKKLPALTQESPLSWPGIRTPIRASEPPTAPLPELQKTIDMQIVDQLSLEEAGRLIAVQTGITITVADDIRGTTLADISWHGAAAGAPRLPVNQTWFPMESCGTDGCRFITRITSHGPYTRLSFPHSGRRQSDFPVR